ncbi:trypsin-like peptidase domain-containing protein [Hyphomicrobium sp.]|uniref:trypsin-like peptidase domain-containing protein n=1 Tax=Hyphomicrobium sp. TaxID=82 RepID=UPI002D77A949|nr:trypsin-like peptidase domain-containing protein [Hyphomicrobium sp.]HET6388231.1 trypsin-like peptidase domain-containing protein [Hyphomicrobium sp.]
MTIDAYSVTSLKLDMLCGSVSIGTATGFIYERNGESFLVSNWHVFSGRHPGTGQALRRDAAIPDEVCVSVNYPIAHGLGKSKLALPLISTEGVPLWKQHARGQDFDVSVLPLQHLTPVYHLPEPGEENGLSMQVSMDCYILGFPEGIAHQGNLPIWKRASIATEPELPHNELPVFLVDTATRHGMSGSPVLLRSFGTALMEDGTTHTGAGVFTRFIGVYSGRYGADDELAVQLGRVWHRHLIDEIIDDPKSGAYELRPSQRSP